MKAVVLHGQVPPGASKDEQDVLVQVAVILQALSDLGFTPVVLPLSLDLASVAKELWRLRPAFVFNLVETVQGKGQYIHLGPTLLEGLHLPYTGATTATMVATSNKLLAKKILAAAELPTPPWLSMESVLRDAVLFPGPYIIKSVWEHGSVGLDEDAVIAVPALLKPTLEHRSHEPAAPWFVERYIHGREFNLSLLAGPHGPELLPPAEIDFTGYPVGKARIVGYRAKWEEDSVEYQCTCRRFDFPPADTPLLEQLAELALACWRLFELRGYGRIDVRVDEAGHPWILEVNANPCLAPESGFVAAAERAGWQFAQVVQRIIADSWPSSLCSTGCPRATT